ncbi:MAG: hypothetical protein EXR86_16265, partial [Gammaproteobacteria bacterium]|nr:hypothetical protein [Gammaproteobacteria bacterium]
MFYRPTKIAAFALLALPVLALGALSCLPALAAESNTRQSMQDWPTGPYQVMENWPQPLPDTRHSHEGWT